MCFSHSLRGFFFYKKDINRILALCTPEVSRTLKETDDDVEFATDMEEPVCEGSEEHNHQLKSPMHMAVMAKFLHFENSN